MSYEKDQYALALRYERGDGSHRVSDCETAGDAGLVALREVEACLDRAIGYAADRHYYAAWNQTNSLWPFLGSAVSSFAKAAALERVGPNPFLLPWKDEK